MARWTEEGKKEVSKVVYKFGVFEVINQPRSFTKGIFHAGKATNVKADIYIKQTAMFQNNAMVEIPKELQTVQGPSSLSWYRYQWDAKARLLSLDTKEAAKKLIEEWKTFSNNPTYLILNYLKNESLDEIALGRDGFLMLFLTIPESKGFIVLSQLAWREFGKYVMQLRVSSNETCVDVVFELDIRGWNEYTFTWLGVAN